MTEPPLPILRTMDTLSLTGTMAIYDSQTDASERIPQQWRAFRESHPTLGSSSHLYGASPCSNDGKLHYFTGTSQSLPDSPTHAQHLTLESGEYAVAHVNDPTLLRPTWIWLLKTGCPPPVAGKGTHQSSKGSPPSQTTAPRPAPSNSGSPWNHAHRPSSGLIPAYQQPVPSQ